MKLCIVSLKKFFYSDKTYWTYGGFGEYVKSLYPYFDKINLCVPVTTDMMPGAYKMNHPKLSFTHIPYYQNELELLLRWPIIFWSIRDSIKKSDIVNPRIPDMTGVAGWLWAKYYNKPHFVSVVSDMHSFLSAPNNTKTKGIVKIGLYTWLRLYLLFEKKIFQESLCFPQGRRLFNRYPLAAASYEWLSSSVYDEDIADNPSFNKNNNCIKILHVGRITRAKGHIHLLEMIPILKEILPGKRIELRCIGKKDKHLLSHLQHKAEELGISQDIRWIGNVRHGKELWNYYDNADIFVFSSIWEGTPKVLLEAMARGLPVVSTNVGGIPSLIKHKTRGLLVPPQNPNVLAHKVAKMLMDDNLRKKCIKNGLEFAKNHTVEAQTQYMLYIFNTVYPNNIIPGLPDDKNISE